ncbi:Cro/Cl family transcriptional regulator, partial [Bordetella avium]
WPELAAAPTLAAQQEGAGHV